MSVRKLDEKEVQARLSAIPDWEIRNNKLHREYRFKDFKNAFAFMTKTSHACERLEHHPEWMNIYSWVTIDLWTHDASGISEKDFDLAEEMERFAKEQE